MCPRRWICPHMCSQKWRQRRRLIQVLTGSFPCGQWLNKLGRGQGEGCELCRQTLSERRGASRTDKSQRQWGIAKCIFVRARKKHTITAIDSFKRKSNVL
jgi:hypothetical protein